MSAVLRALLMVTSLALTPFMVAAQPSELKALEQQLTSARGEQRVDLLNEIAKGYWGVSTERSLHHAEAAADLGRQLDYLSGVATAYRYIGIAEWYASDYPAALQATLDARQLFDQLDDRQGVAACLSTVGTIHLSLEQFDAASSSFQQALVIAEDIGDENRMGIVLSNLGTTQLGLDRPADALPYLERALAILERSGSPLDMLTALGNFGSAYQRLDRHAQAIDINQRILSLAREIDSRVRIIDALADLGESYTAMGDFDAGVEHLEQAVEQARLWGLKRNLQDSLLSLTEHYAEAGRPELALDAHKQHVAVRAEIIDEERARAMADLEARYESERRQRQIEIMELELAQRETIQLALAVMAMLLAIVAVVYHGRYRARRRAAELLETLSRTDPLTGLNNRRAMTESLARNRNFNERDGRPFSVLLLDVDRFKGFNDHHGHDCGDRVLRELSDCLKAVVRGGDEVARWGGEEFLVLAPETRQQEAELLAQRIAEAIRDLIIDHEGEALTVTATIGLAEFRRDETIEACVQRTDAALLRGKSEGGDKIVAA